MRTKPSLDYSGLTIILDGPSRHDKEHLLSGLAGVWFQEECLGSLPLSTCDIRTADHPESLMAGTNKVLLLGEKSARQFASVSCDPPGYPLIARGTLAMAAFDPQDCDDFRNLKADDEDSEGDDSSDRDTKERQPTRRKNFRFWTMMATRKLIKGPTKEPSPDIQVYPNLEKVCSLLEHTRNQNLYLDIETSRAYRALSCIGFSTDELFPTIFVVPIYSFSGTLAYGNIHLFYKALSLALHRNQVVIHNSHFDLLVLHAFYKFPLPAAVYDTMLAQHRIYPEAEKSLAHTIATWTWQPYHKDQNTEVFSPADQRKLWNYNARDVFNLKLIKDAQELQVGCQSSIRQANDSVLPYLEQSLKGMEIDQIKLAAVHRKLLAQQNLFAKIARILTGKPAFNPGSADQCAKWFHDTLGYPVVSRTETGRPALGKKQLYQLQLKGNNPLLPVILRYRKVAKEASMLESELWEPC